MATTDARAGFRLPWSSDRPSTEETDSETTDGNAPAEASAWPTDESVVHAEAPTETAEAPTTEAPTESDVVDASAETVEPAADVVDASAEPVALRAAAGKKPNKFMADLTKAMQAAAEDARSRALSQLQADAKTHVETIHGRSATEAADLRRAADDDVASVREWSKAEIARIREETESKITDRKQRLEGEIEGHVGVIEREIEAVQGTVAAFEEEMAAFFERLLREDDPSRIATMAENLPEPPTFEGIVAAEPVAEEVATTPTDELETVTEPDALPEAADEATEVEAEAVTAESVTAETDDASETTEAVADDLTADATIDPSADYLIGEGEGEGADGEVDREAAFAAIQAAAEAAASAEVAADAAARAEAVADIAIEIVGGHEGEPESESDPRFAALGLSPDYDAAEAEALAAANPSDGEEIPTIGDDALAARLAGLVPSSKSGKAAGGETGSTQVIVVGLVSVASIASFKRHLGRVSGVQSVGVSSGPDGEFVFAVNHNQDIVIRDAIPSLPSFQARVTSSSDGVVHVSAHDPESDN